MITPCIKACNIAPDTQTCIGCFRTLQEIRDWRYLTDDKRTAIIQECRLRERLKNEEAKEKSECPDSVHAGYSIQTKSGEE